MNIGQLFIEALESLASNKLRSGLTMLGIVIGVAAVISMLAIGNGAQASITNSINSIGSNLLFVSGGAQGVRNPRPLTLEDAQALSDPSQAPDIKTAAPVLQERATVTFGSQTTNTSITAVTSGYADIRSLTTTEGEFITDAQVSGRSAVAVLGSTTAQNLFGSTVNVVGETIRIQGQPFRVTGVLASKGGSGLGSQDDVVLVPLTTGQSRLIRRGQADRVDQILVQAVSADTVQAASDEVTSILMTRHHVSTADFTILKQQDILNTAQSITGVLTLFLGGIGAISLLVGGIGIMNIMLVSVTERTREIGLRKALGARRSNILVQFLVESSLLSLLGGAVGVLLAGAISDLVARIASSSSTPITPIIDANAVLLATLFSAAVGLFFGLYPANRASRLEPVEALRTE
jgi:putative ABC transport system permease protein